MSLIRTNKYLRDPKQRREAILCNTRGSFLFEGASAQAVNRAMNDLDQLCDVDTPARTKASVKKPAN